MWSFWAVIIFTTSVCFSEIISPNYYCADMNPQLHINIEQLMGMWYGIEIMIHNAEGQHYTQTVPSCPIIHLSEQKDYYYPSSTFNPLYKDYDIRHNYGERRDYTRRPYDRNYDRNKYSKTTPYPYNNRNYNIGRYGQKSYNLPGYPTEMKRIRLYWDENGSGTEYLLRYNETRPGFWISSGPQNGSELEPLYSNFAGTIQVIKAVGNHLVLTFCHQLPDKQLFTVLLSREHKLDKTDIHGVHSLLNRRGLSTSAIKRVCSNSSGRRKLAFSAFILLLGLSLIWL